MRFLILFPDYADFMRSFYAAQPGLAEAPYAEQLAARNSSLFGVADAWSRNLNLLGHETVDIYVNNSIMQQAWARERDITARIAAGSASVIGTAGRHVRNAVRAAISPRMRAWIRERVPIPPRRDNLLEEILVEQAGEYRPDVIVNTALDTTHPGTLRRLKPLTRLLVGQVASPFHPAMDLSAYDMILTSLPHLGDWFRGQGIPSHLHRLGFDPAVLEAVPVRDRDIPVSFVGALTAPHGKRIAWLEAVCAKIDVAVWGTGVEHLSSDSPIRRNHHGEAWGVDMYEILGRSKITLNHHIDMAGPHANNMRLYEATGMGALLVTDNKENLSDMFEPGREVVTHANAAECIEKIEYYVEHDEERGHIAQLGHFRTLSEHNYHRRMLELVDILVPALEGKP